MPSLYSDASSALEIPIEAPRRRHRGFAHELTHLAEEGGPIDLTRAERRQVPGRHLAIDHPEAPALKLPRQQDQRDLGRVAAPAEHRLAEEHAAERDAVESAGQFLATPRFDRMGVPEGEQAP